MLKEVLDVVEFISPQINFASSTLIFFAGGYIALHNRVMPRWVVTCLWYLGLFALFNAITFLVEWTLGQSHPLSHFQIGHAAEALVNSVFAVTVCLLFFHTVWQDYIEAKKRKKLQAVHLTSKSKTKTAPVRATVKKASIKKGLHKIRRRPSIKNNEFRETIRLEF